MLGSMKASVAHAATLVGVRLLCDCDSRPIRRKAHIPALHSSLRRILTWIDSVQSWRQTSDHRLRRQACQYNHPEAVDRRAEAVLSMTRTTQPLVVGSDCAIIPPRTRLPNALFSSCSGRTQVHVVFRIVVYVLCSFVTGARRTLAHTRTIYWNSFNGGSDVTRRLCLEQGHFLSSLTFMMFHL